MASEIHNLPRGIKELLTLSNRSGASALPSGNYIQNWAAIYLETYQTADWSWREYSPFQGLRVCLVYSANIDSRCSVTGAWLTTET